MGSDIVGVHRQQGIAITMLLFHHGERAIALSKGGVSAPFARTDRVMSFPGRIVRWSGCWAKSREMAMMGRNRRCPRIGARIRAETLAKALQMAL